MKKTKTSNVKIFMTVLTVCVINVHINIHNYLWFLNLFFKINVEHKGGGY
jgi:hypothetical protein